jgi:hypothetical protein
MAQAPLQQLTPAAGQLRAAEAMQLGIRLGDGDQR